jgi:hypothetical protein
MSIVIRQAEPDVFFHENAGYLVPPKPSNLAPILLIARCGRLGLRANGTLVRLHRPEEWTSGLYGDWSEIEMKCRGLTEEQTIQLLEATESMLLLPEKSLSQDTLALACLVWAQSHVVQLMPLRRAIDQIDEQQEIINLMQQRINLLQGFNDVGT